MPSFDLDLLAPINMTVSGEGNLINTAVLDFPRR
jgi:hypothetical protein